MELNLQDAINEVKKQIEAIPKGITSEELEKRTADITADFEKKFEAFSKSFDEKKKELAGEAKKANFSISKAVKAIKEDRFDAAPVEKEIMEATKKAMSSVTGADGGYMIFPEYVPGMIEYLYNASVLVKAGAVVLNNLTGFGGINFVKQSTTTTPSWLPEKTAPTEGTPQTGKVTMTPKKCMGLSYVPNELLRFANTNPSADMFIMNDLTRSIANQIDYAGLFGTGVNDQPKGITAVDGINSIAIGENGGSFTFKIANRMRGKVLAANSYETKPAFIMHSNIRTLLAETKPVYYSGQAATDIYTDAEITGKLGAPLLITNYIPLDGVKGNNSACSTIIYGDFSELIIANWGAIELVASPHPLFTTDQTIVRAIQHTDVMARHIECFCKCVDATSTVS